MQIKDKEEVLRYHHLTAFFILNLNAMLVAAKIDTLLDD